MEDLPLVSVIMPTYNRAEYLGRSIGSVLKQTYPYWELIIWDDGSTDNTEEIVRSYTDERIKYFHDNNHGVAYARNRSIEVSRGKYLAFLDSDDEWVEKKLFIQIEAMKTHPQIDVLLGNYSDINISSQENIPAFEQYLSAMKLLEVEQVEDSVFIINRRLLESLTVSNYFLLSSILFQRELLERIGYFTEELRNSEDFVLWWRMGLAGVCVSYMDNIFVRRYKLPGSLSSPGILAYENKLRGLDICLQETLTKGRKDLVPYLYRSYRNAWQNMIPLYGRQGNRRKTVKAFYKSMSYGFSLGSVRLFLESINTKSGTALE